MAIQLTVRFFALLALLVISGTSTKVFASEQKPVPATSEPMVIKYHHTLDLEDQHAYNFELIHRILEITRPEFGDYKEEPYGQAPTAKRQASLLSEGKLLNVHWAPPGTDIALADVIPIPIDILRGLQGYRVCLVNAQAGVNFSRINSVDTLKGLRIAQGAHWAEIPIYLFNGIKPIDAPGTNGLFLMLGLKRFDCIPLGVNEIETMYKQESPHYPFMAIEPSLLIVYDSPIYFYVSKKFPKIAERFSLGLNRLLANGDFDRLFNHYHKKNIEQLKLGNRTVICLKSPFSDNQKQCPQPFLLPDFIQQVKP
jgi:ABC-type amino acid transport substrate-binding protein